LWSKERFCRPLKNCSFESELPYLGWRSADFLQIVLSQKIFAGPVRSYILALVLRFLWWLFVRAPINRLPTLKFYMCIYLTSILNVFSSLWKKLRLANICA
jgi:hypothetical protein